MRHQQHRVYKCIFQFWPPPNSPLVLLGILMSLSIAVLPKGRPKVQRVDVMPRSAPMRLVPRVLSGRMQPLKTIEGLRRHDWWRRRRRRSCYVRLHGWRWSYRALVTGDYPIEGSSGSWRLRIASGLPEGRPSVPMEAPPGVDEVRRMGVSLERQAGSSVIERGR